MELAKEQINFLDVNISQREGALQKLSEKSKYGVISGPYFPVFGMNTEI